MAGNKYGNAPNDAPITTPLSGDSVAPSQGPHADDAANEPNKTREQSTTTANKGRKAGKPPGPRTP